MKPLRSSAPAHSILNPAFDYTDAANTDIAARFRRMQREQADIARARAEQQAREAARTNVRTIPRKERKA